MPQQLGEITPAGSGVADGRVHMCHTVRGCHTCGLKGSLAACGARAAPVAEYSACMSAWAAAARAGCRNREVGGTSARAAGTSAASGCSISQGVTRKAPGTPSKSSSCAHEDYSRTDDVVLTFSCS